MWYLGGKKRQAPVIVAAVRKLRPSFRAYVEPFCGGMWSAVAMIKAFPGRRFILNDANPYLMRFWTAAIKERWNPPRTVTETDYARYNRDRPVDDPMTGYIGFAMSFGGKFFGGWARNTAGVRDFSRETSKASLEKIAVLRAADVSLMCGDYHDCSVPDDSIVYLDPPYDGRTKQASFNRFDAREYHTWAEELSGRCCVIATEFSNPRHWPVIHDFGDTVVRHHASKGRDGTRELLLRVRPCSNQCDVTSPSYKDGGLYD